MIDFLLSICEYGQSRFLKGTETVLSFKGDVQTFSQVVRGHWSVENLHWLLDVVY